MRGAAGSASPLDITIPSASRASSVTRRADFRATRDWPTVIGMVQGTRIERSDTCVAMK